MLEMFRDVIVYICYIFVYVCIVIGKFYDCWIYLFFDWSYWICGIDFEFCGFGDYCFYNFVDWNLYVESGC